jgi:integrase
MHARRPLAQAPPGDLAVFSTFARLRPTPLDRHTATRKLRARCKALSFIGRLSSHTAHKIFARHVHQRSGHNLSTCQRALRHANIQTTLSYVSADEDVLTAILAH